MTSGWLAPAPRMERRLQGTGSARIPLALTPNVSRTARVHGPTASTSCSTSMASSSTRVSPSRPSRSTKRSPRSVHPRSSRPGVMCTPPRMARARSACVGGQSDSRGLPLADVARVHATCSAVLRVSLHGAQCSPRVPALRPPRGLPCGTGHGQTPPGAGSGAGGPLRSGLPPPPSRPPAHTRPAKTRTRAHAGRVGWQNST